jgi:autotransporter translocation and assembly factor TamB
MARGRAWRVVRGIGRWTLRVSIGLVVLVVAVVMLLLYSPAMLRLAVGQGLGFYNGRIPGHIAVAGVEGRLVDGFTLRGVHITDRGGRTLVAADSLGIQWSAWSLLRGSVEVSGAAIADAQVYLWSGPDGSAFADLAPEGPEEPEEEGAGVGPNLPLRISVSRLDLADVDVYGGDGRPIAEELRLAAAALGEGREATLQVLDAAGELPGVDLHALELTAKWTDPVVELAGVVLSDVAAVELTRVRLDAAALSGEVTLAVAGRRARLAELLEPPLADALRAAPSDPGLTLAVTGSAAELRAELRAAAPGLATLDLTVTGSAVARADDGAAATPPGRAPSLVADVALRADLRRMLGVPVGVVQPTLHADLDGADWHDLRASLDLRCAECGPASGLTLGATAARDPVTDELRARVDLGGAGLEVEGEAVFAGGDLRAGEATVRARDLRRPAAVARGFAPVPAVAGALEVRARCDGSPLTCAGAVDLREFRGFGAALASLAVELRGQPLGPELAAEAHVALADLRVRGQRIAGAEAVVTLGPAPEQVGGRGTGAKGQVASDMSPGTGGAPDAAGRGSGPGVGQQVAKEVAEGASDVADDATTAREQVAKQIAVQAGEAAGAKGPAIPPLEIGIEAEAWTRTRTRGDRVRVAGRVRPGPPLWIEVRGLEAQVRGVAAALAGPTTATIAGRRYAVRGLDLRAAGGRVTADGHVDLDGRSDLRVEALGLRLDQVAAAVPRLRRQVAGTLSLRASLQGASRDPDISVRVDGRRLRYQTTMIGDLVARADLDRRRASAEVALTNTMARRVAVSGETALLADLSRGRFGVRPGPLHVDVDVEQFQLRALRPLLGGLDLRGRVDAHAAVRGPAEAPELTLTVAARDLAEGHAREAWGDLDASFTHADGRLRGSLDAHRLEARVHLDVAAVPVTVDLVGKQVKWRAEEPHAATLVVRNFDLWRQLTPHLPGQDAAGVLGLELKLAGTGAAPEVDLTVDGSRLRVREADLGTLALKAGYREEKATLELGVRGGVPGEVKLTAAAPVRVTPAGEAKVTWLKDEAHALDLRLLGVDLGGLRAAGLDVPLKGRLTARVQAGGTAADPGLQARVEVQKIVWRVVDVGTLTLTAGYADQRADVALRGRVGLRGTVDVEGHVPLKVDLGRGEVAWDRAGRHDLRVDLTGIDRSVLIALAPLPQDALMEVGVHATARGNLDRFAADLEMHGQMGHRVFGGSPLHVTAHADERAQRARVSLGPGGFAGDFGVKAETRADIPALIAGKAKAGQIPVTASLRAPKVDLRFLKAVVPRSLYDLTGVFSAQVDVDGVVGAPRVRGRARLKDGGVTVVSMQQRLRGIYFDARADGRRIVVDDIRVTSGRGKITGKARVDVAPGSIAVDASAALRKFPLVRPGTPQMQIDSDVTSKVVVADAGTDVDIALKGTKVLVTGYTVRAPQAIPDNPNVTYVGAEGDETVRPGEHGMVGHGATGLEDEPDAPGAAEPGRMSLKLRLVDPIDFTGPLTEMRWGGNLAVVTGGPDETAVTGKLLARSGRFDLLGNRFKIETGEVTMPAGELTVDPYLHVVAAATTPVAKVKVTIRGRASKPEMIFSSEPAMPQQQILTLLLTGSADASEADSQRVLAEAAALLVVVRNPALANFVTKSLGVDYIGVSFGETTSQPILTVGKHIGRKIYAETAYKHNAPPRTNRVEARVEYQLAPAWTIESYFGDAAVGGVDLFWRRIFGKPRRRGESTAKAPPRTPAGDVQRGKSGGTTGGGGTGP